MTIQKIEKSGVSCALVESDEVVIRDAQSALDLLMSAKQEAGTKNLVIAKKCICEDFFILSTGLAGEILQKFVNYGAPRRLRRLFALYEQAASRLHAREQRGP